MSLFLIKFERVFSQWKKSNLSQTIATEFARKVSNNSTSTIHIYMKAQPKKFLDQLVWCVPALNLLKKATSFICVMFIFVV